MPCQKIQGDIMKFTSLEQKFLLNKNIIDINFVKISDNMSYQILTTTIKLIKIYLSLSNIEICK